MLSTYAAKYRSLKAPRKLVWRPNLGTVQLELAIGDQQLEFNVRRRVWGMRGHRLVADDSRRRRVSVRLAGCPAAAPPPSLRLPGPAPHAQVSPLHAAVLMRFQQQAEWLATELAQALGVAPEALRRKAVFWINQGARAGGRQQGWLPADQARRGCS